MAHSDSLLISQTHPLESDTAAAQAAWPCHSHLYSVCVSGCLREWTEDIPALKTHKDLLNIHTAGKQLHATDREEGDYNTMHRLHVLTLFTRIFNERNVSQRRGLPHI